MVLIVDQWNTELLTELARREKDAGIFPEAEIDLYMKATAMQGVESSLITDYTLRVISALYLPLRFSQGRNRETYVYFGLTW